MFTTPSGSQKQAGKLILLQSRYRSYLHTTYGTLGYNSTPSCGIIVLNHEYDEPTLPQHMHLRALI